MAYTGFSLKSIANKLRNEIYYKDELYTKDEVAGSVKNQPLSKLNLSNSIDFKGVGSVTYDAPSRSTNFLDWNSNKRNKL